MDLSQGVGAGLEDRLRNLILSNSGGANDGPSSPGPGSQGLRTAPLPQSQPQDSPFAQTSAPSVLDSSEDVSGEAVPSLHSTKHSKKRPNQAQRRQMSAQLSIPIDHRPPPPPHSARQYVSPPAYGGHQHHPTPYYGGQRPQSATLRPTHHTHASPNHPATEAPYPVHSRHHQSRSYHGPMSHPDQQDWRSRPPRHGSSHHVPVFPFDAPSPRATRDPGTALYNPGHSSRHYQVKPEDLKYQVTLLEDLCNEILGSAEIDFTEIQEKERFRLKIEQICRVAISRFEEEESGMGQFPADTVQLKCFGSLSSGFATKASDLDLALVSPLSRCQPDDPDSPIPRLVEKAFLEAGLGARLLTRTRVPIIKLCEQPPEKLRQDLLEERAKWDKGLPSDQEGVDADDLHEEDDHAPAHEEKEAAEVQASRRNEAAARGEELNPEKYKATLAELKQPEKQLLANYYGTAKRLLRRLGGREVTHANLGDFKDSDFRTLTDVCEAFVHGLADQQLKKRLLGYRSLSFAPTPSLPCFRSLAGVYTQIEGEKSAMMWDSRQVREKDEQQEQSLQNRIRLWTDIQNKPTFGFDPLAYNKELQAAATSLRTIPSIQVMTLEQSQYEPPGQYHSRAIRLLLDLGSHDTPSPENKTLMVIRQRYVSGIWNEDIRNAVEGFVKAETEGIVTLRAVARRHKSLQLAWEFERAVGKGLYEKADVDVIKAYVDLLRSPLRKSDPMEVHFDYVVPKTPETAALIDQVRDLPDPSRLAPNQPRDPYRDSLEFPKDGAGVQCDINFSAHLALQNTLLLRCYARTDPRVRPMILFIKHWAKVRDVNTPYRGTLSSYGYVLMALHYLVNVAQPFVCPNLQQLARPPPPGLSPEQVEETVVCKGRNVQFWRDEEEIGSLASQGTLNQNRDSLGHLLRGFFEYYAHGQHMSTVPARGFDWGRDVLSLRTPGGLVGKQTKGWTGAKTVVEVQPQAPTAPPAAQNGGPSPVESADTASQPATADGRPASKNGPKTGGEVREVRHRYLFAIEDPFELDHNVARTVTHNGIVAIRDEFRRAWRIIKNAGKAGVPPEPLLQPAAADKRTERDVFAELLDEIHGRKMFSV